MQFHKRSFGPAHEPSICSLYRSYKRQLHHGRKSQSRAQHVDPAERILLRPCPPLCREPFASGCLTPIDRRPDERPKAEQQIKSTIGTGMFSCYRILRIPDLVTHLDCRTPSNLEPDCAYVSPSEA